MSLSVLPSVLAPVLLYAGAPVEPVGPFAIDAAVSANMTTNAAEQVTDQVTVPEDDSDEIVVSARLRDAPVDPLRALNETSFAATVAVDEALARPAALAYARVVPEPLRDGLRNVLDNLREPVSFLNYLLQLNPIAALYTVVRFVVNSTIGIAGVFDIAKRRPLGLIRHRNGLGNTLAYYGVKPGAFFYVPLLGPTTLRDLIGGFVDRAILPFAVGKPFNRASYNVPVGVLSTLDRRARNDDRIQKLRDTDEPYLAARRAYLARRQLEIDALRTQR